MIRAAVLRLPGVHFLPVAALPRPQLPPLHEALFVGFAQRGPLHRPIPVEVAEDYANVFGDDLALARRPDGGLIHAHLRSAVHAFLANGGRRCHLVRVAGPNARPAEYRLGGLWAVAPDAAGKYLTPQPVRVEAAWPGAWAKDLSVAVQVESRPLPPAAFRVIGATTLRWQAGPAPQALAVGDVLRIEFAGGVQRLFPVTAIDIDTSAAGAVTLQASCVTATRLRAGKLPSVRLRRARPLGVERLRLVPWWREAGILERSQVALSFNAGGPGYWGDALPLATSRSVKSGWLTDVLTARPRPAGASAGGTVASDAARLFRALARDDCLAWEADGIAERAMLGARLAPLAAAGDGATLFLPIGMPSTPPAEGGWTDAEVAGDDDLAERSSNDAFLDAALLGPLGESRPPDALLAAAWQRQYATKPAPIDPAAGQATAEAEWRRQQVTGRRLSGIHAAFGVESAALVAMPDAAQPGWAPAADQATIDGFAPANGPLGGGTTLTISGHGFVRDRTHLRLGGKPVERLRVLDERTLICRTPAAARAGFAAIELHVGAGAEVHCSPGFAYLDVPAPADFSACVAPPRLDRVSPATGPASGGTRVRLRGHRFAAPAGVSFGGVPAQAVRVVNDRLIVCVTPGLSSGHAVDVVVETPRGRSAAEGGFLPRAGRPPAVQLPVAGTPEDFDPVPLLELQRELLVVCAARADAVAILSLPQHFRRRDCVAWRSALAERLGALAGGDTLSDREDVSVDSYGAVYHPWVHIAAAADGRRAVPPEGAACGIVAARELARQVWVAPARVAVIGAVGLDLHLADSEAADLVDRQFNLLRAEAGDILPIAAHTLEAGRSLRQLSVRRLMILLRKLLLERGAEFAFETHHERFREAVQVELDQLLGRLHALGAFAGSTPLTAFRVTADASVNPPASVDAGRFVAIVQVAPSQPGEFIQVRLERSGAGELRVSGG